MFEVASRRRLGALLLVVSTLLIAGELKQDPISQFLFCLFVCFGLLLTLSDV